MDDASNDFSLKSSRLKATGVFKSFCLGQAARQLAEREREREKERESFSFK